MSGPRFVVICLLQLWCSQGEWALPKGWCRFRRSFIQRWSWSWRGRWLGCSTR